MLECHRGIFSQRSEEAKFPGDIGGNSQYPRCNISQLLRGNPRGDISGPSVPFPCQGGEKENVSFSVGISPPTGKQVTGKRRGVPVGVISPSVSYNQTDMEERRPFQGCWEGHLVS